ncbi:MAG: hypothetical protein WDA16_11445 [Candidatus Thermoplasmatota archaeon]
MRAITIVLLVSILGSVAATVHAAAPAFESRGSYTAGNPVGALINSCDIWGDANNLWSSCRSLGGVNIDGLVARVRDEAVTAPATQASRVCFYAEINFKLDCPPDEKCVDWAWCAHVPDGARVFGVTSTTGVKVQWHLIIE